MTKYENTCCAPHGGIGGVKADEVPKGRQYFRLIFWI